MFVRIMGLITLCLLDCAQDFRMLVVNPVTQTLNIRVRDNVGYLGLTTTTVGSIEVSVPCYCD